jgi:hypothetical protein
VGDLKENVSCAYVDFLRLFEPLGPAYSDLTKLVDKYVGFSVQREYPAGIAFKPALLPNGQPDSVALIHILIDPELPTDGEKTLVRVRVSKFSKYLSNNFDYDFSDENCPTEESIKLSQASIQPEDLMLIREYFIAGSPAQLFDKSNMVIDGKGILDSAFQKHLETLRRLSTTQLRNRASKIEAKLLPLLGRLTRFMLVKIFGRQLVPDKEMKFLFYGYAPEDVRKISTESIKFFDYLVPKPVAILFCLIIAIAFFCFHFLGGSSSYLKAISQSSVLAATHGILVLALLNDVVPLLLRKALNIAIVRGGRIPGFPIREFM